MTPLVPQVPQYAVVASLNTFIDLKFTGFIVDMSSVMIPSLLFPDLCLW